MGNFKHRASFSQKIKSLYVHILLSLLPFLVNAAKHLSSRIKPEIEYLGKGHTFQFKVEHSGLSCVCRFDENGRLRSVPYERRARDIEAGSGLTSTDPNAIAIDYIIIFRSLDYAFACFSGSLSLKEALAERAFATRGPNEKGVALTYLFTDLLRLFFFWRRLYRSKGVAHERI